jgi:hypothetical protein
LATRDTIDTYFAAWNELDPAKRRSLIEKCWADDGTYVDPMSDVAGRDGLDSTITGFHAQMPGASIILNGAIDEHHGRLRFPWALQAADGTMPIKGIDVGQLAPDGRLASILGFWDNAPGG